MIYEIYSVLSKTSEQSSLKLTIIFHKPGLYAVHGEPLSRSAPLLYTGSRIMCGGLYISSDVYSFLASQRVIK